jgi:hypothetical protein
LSLLSGFIMIRKSPFPFIALSYCYVLPRRSLIQSNDFERCQSIRNPRETPAIWRSCVPCACLSVSSVIARSEATKQSIVVWEYAHEYGLPRLLRRLAMTDRGSEQKRLSFLRSGVAAQRESSESRVARLRTFRECAQAHDG